MYRFCKILPTARSSSRILNRNVSADQIRFSGVHALLQTSHFKACLLPNFLKRFEYSSSPRRSAASNAPKPFVLIEFEGKTTKFRVPVSYQLILAASHFLLILSSQNHAYNFGNLLQDASAYFKVDGGDFDLKDAEHIIWY
jgi:hypothetical protein